MFSKNNQLPEFFVILHTIHKEIMYFALDSCILRRWNISDAAVMRGHADNFNIACNLRDGFPHPYTMDDAIRWLTGAVDNHTDWLLAITINDEAIGSIGVIFNGDIFRLSADIGYWLSEEHWNKGIITECVTVLTKHVFDTTDIIRIQAGILEHNAASMRVLEKAGYHLEAVHKNAIIKNGVIEDEYLYVRLKTV